MKNLLLIPILFALSFQAQAGFGFSSNEYELLVRADSTQIMDKAHQAQSENKNQADEKSNQQSINWSWI